MVHEYLMANKVTSTPEQVEKAVQIIAKHLAKKRKQQSAEIAQQKSRIEKDNNFVPTAI